MKTIDAVSKIMCQATKEVLETSTGKSIVYSNTIQKIPRVHLKPEIGCFVLFNGDYSGLMIMNFDAKAALEIYKTSMMKMGLPEEDLAIEYTADEVVDSIGELINQVIGKVRSQVENQYGLVATNTQPKAIALNSAIILSIDGHDVSRDFCRRLSFKIGNFPFHIELSLEQTEFIALEGKDIHAIKGEAKKSTSDVNMDDYSHLKEDNAPAQKAPDPTAGFDFDSLKAVNDSK